MLAVTFYDYDREPNQIRPVNTPLKMTAAKWHYLTFMAVQTGYSNQKPNSP